MEREQQACLPLVSSVKGQSLELRKYLCSHGTLNTPSLI